MLKDLVVTLLAAGLSTVAAPALAQSRPHQHGVVKLDVAIEGGQLSVALEVPLDSLVGFERAPRTTAEKRTASEALARLQDAASLFKPDAAAQCTVAAVEVSAAALQGSAESGAKRGHEHEHQHADLDAAYRFQCAQPQQLRALDVGLFDAFKRIRRIDAQVATDKGQFKLTLERSARTVVLVK